MTNSIKSESTVGQTPTDAKETGTHDADQRRRAEEALRESEETLRTTLNSIGDAVISTDMEGRVVSMNPVAESLTGWLKKEAAGQPIETVFRIINEQTRKPVESPVINVLKSGRIVGLANHTLLIAKDEREIPIADSGAPIRSEQGKTTGVVMVFRDQTNERMAQRALEESEARFRTIYDFMAIGVARVSLGFCIEAANQSYCDMLGYTEAELIGKHLKDITDPEIVEENLQKQQLLAEGKIDHFRMEKSFIHKNGAKIHGLLDANLIRDADRMPAYFLGSVVDITPRKRAEDALQANYALLQIAGETAGFGAWSVDLEKKICTWSDTVADIHDVPRGYAPPLGEGLNFYAPEWHQKINQVFTTCAKKGIPYDEEMEIISQTGRRVWVRTAGKAVKDDKGKIIKVQGAFQDITERKQAEERLRQSEDRFRAIVEGAPDAVFVQTEKKFAYLNSRAIHLFGAEKESDLLGKPVLSLLHPDYHNQVLERIRRLNEERQPIIEGMEQKYLRLDGSEVWVETTGHPIDFGGKKGALVFVRDIADRKRTEAEKTKLQAQLIHAQKMESVGRLAGGVAHDFNNMLGVIFGHAEMALKKIDPAQPLYADLREICKAAQRSADLTRQLLTFARKQTISPRVINLNETVEGMLKMLRRLIGEDIDLLWKPGGNLWPVKVDPSQIDQLLANLCVNARDAIAGVGKITIETVDVTFDEDYCADHAGFMPGKYVLLAVSDNGCGMDKDTMGHLFEPFFTTKKPGQGTGLGLASVYGMVKQNNGFINVYSEPGQGTTFKIYLPQYAAKSASLQEKSQDKAVERGHETILLVEDEPMVLEMATLMLQSLGYTVVSAGTPGEAIRLAREHSGRIDLLLTDVVMPEMNGRDLAKNLISLYPDLKRLFMSGYTANVIAHHGVLDEGVHFIQKPFSMKDLAAKVHEALGQ
jgi:two-component system, cell cycle sensor histidine kinase and response regulator CckA